MRTAFCPAGGSCPQIPPRAQSCSMAATTPCWRSSPTPAVPGPGRLYGAGFEGPGQGGPGETGLTFTPEGRSRWAQCWTTRSGRC